MKKDEKVLLLGSTGLVGSAIYRCLKSKQYTNILTPSSKDLDLTKQQSVELYFEKNRPKYVILSAAYVGGIHANNVYCADFIYKNLLIQTHTIHSAYQFKVAKLLFMGSSCIYPRNAPQPLREDYILSGKLEKTNEAYALAKIAGLKMCESYNKQYGTSFISVMPCNVYGPGDNFDLNKSHVLPAMIRKCHEAKINDEPHIELWGDGTPKREFIHSDDLANACLFMMNCELPQKDVEKIYNIGTEKEITIAELATLIKNITKYKGNIIWNKNMPNGTPRKVVSISRIKQLGWEPSISLKNGIKQVYEWYLNTKEEKRL